MLVAFVMGAFAILLFAAGIDSSALLAAGIGSVLGLGSLLLEARDVD